MSTDMTLLPRAALLERLHLISVLHGQTNSTTGRVPFCGECGDVWPCDTITIIAYGETL